MVVDHPRRLHEGMEERLDRQPLCLTEYNDELTRRFVERIAVVDVMAIFISGDTHGNFRRIKERLTFS